MTAITDSSAALAQAIADFSAVFETAITEKATAAETADNATELQGADLPTTQTELDADLVTHEATNGASHINAAALTAMGVYSQSQTVAKMKGIVPSLVLPISRYGELSYLPVGVSGDFQGATMNFESRMYPGIIENDGTYVFLRNGTTGTVMGVYYAYMKNAINAPSMVAPTRTNFRYQPAYFPAGTSARWVTKSDGNCILGRLQVAATGALGDYFLSITNGTFDASKHVGGVIPAASFPSRLDASCNVEAIVGNTNVYLIVTSSSFAPMVTPVEFQIWSIPIATVQAANGGNITPTQLTGWTTTGFGTTFAGTTNVRVAGMQLSTSAANFPMVTYPASPAMSLSLFVDNNGDMQTDSAQDPASGNIRIRVMGTWFISVLSSGYAVTGDTIFWLNVNPTAKTAALEGPATAPGTCTYNSGNQTAAYSGGMFNTSAGNLVPQPYQGGQSTNVWTKSGYWFSITDSDPPDYGSNIARVKTSSQWANRYAALAPAATVNTRSSVGFVPAYGTALGGRMTGSWLLPGGYMLASSYGPRADGVTLEWGPVLCKPGALGYTYNSQYNGTLNGLAPSTLRSRLTDKGLNIDSFVAMMSEVAANGTVTASGGYFLEGYNVNGYLSVTVVNNVLTGTGSVSLSNAVLQTLKTACWAALGLGAPPVSTLQVMVPQNTTIPPFGFLTWTDASKNLWVAMVELAITGGSRTSAITGMSVVSASTPQQTDTGSVIQPINNSLTWTSGACHIYEGSDAWFVGCTPKTYLVIPGTGAGHFFRFAIPKSTNRPQWSTLYIGLGGVTYNAPFFMGYPGLGFGECDQNPTSSDNYTKITFNVRATTLAQFNAWTAGTTYVLVSQDVAQGWIVYFNAATPLIMNGQYVQIQATSIDLTTIKAAPANTTFYVYVSVNAGVGVYSIFTAAQPETINLMFIGTVVTGATSIASINMQKVSRVDKYRLSATSEGSAISVSPGNPDAAGHLAWQ